MTELPTPADPLDWADRAACADADPEIFFTSEPAVQRQALDLCEGCEVRAECLAYAVHAGLMHGVWGGLVETRRRRLIRDRRRELREGEAA